MSTISRYPCCACVIDDESHSSVFQKNICKLREIDFKRILQSELQLILFYMNPKLVDSTFIMETLIAEESRNVPQCTFDGTNLAFRESRMMRSIYNLLKKMYDQNPSLVDINNVHNFGDINSILTEELDKIVENYNKATENKYAIINGNVTFQTIINGNVTFQRLVLDILLFAAKFMSQCIDNFKDVDKSRIFHNIVEIVDKFMSDRNITGWILHSIQIMDPFGKNTDSIPDIINT